MYYQCASFALIRRNCSLRACEPPPKSNSSLGALFRIGTMTGHWLVLWSWAWWACLCLSRLDENMDCATGTDHIHIGTADVEKSKKSLFLVLWNFCFLPPFGLRCSWIYGSRLNVLWTSYLWLDPNSFPTRKEIGATFVHTCSNGA